MQAVSFLIRNNFTYAPLTHNFFDDIIMRSNTWIENFDQILDTHEI